MIPPRDRKYGTAFAVQDWIRQTELEEAFRTKGCGRNNAYSNIYVYRLPDGTLKIFDRYIKEAMEE